MTIRLLLFGSLAQELDTRASQIDLSDNACVGDALDALALGYPALKKHLPRVATAVNLEYVGLTHVLHDGDELALIPPVSGG
jgi:molybdopterin converting factor small subunit